MHFLFEIRYYFVCMFKSGPYVSMIPKEFYFTTPTKGSQMKVFARNLVAYFVFVVGRILHVQ